LSGSTIIHLPFGEPKDVIRPSDRQGDLDDLATPSGLSTPAVVDALTGNGRRCGDGKGMAGKLYPVPHFVYDLRTQQSWEDLIGISPDHLLLCDGTADPMPDQIGSLDVSEVGSPLREQPTGWPNRVCVESVDGGTADYFEKNGASEMDFDASMSFAFAGYGILTGSPGGSRDVLGFNAASTPRWRFQIAPVSGNFMFRGHDGAVTWLAQVAVAPTVGRVYPFLAWMDRASAVAGMRNPLDVSTDSISSVGTMDTGGTGRFRLMRSASASGPFKMIALAIWSGSKAEGMDTETIINTLDENIAA